MMMSRGVLHQIDRELGLPCSAPTSHFLQLVRNLSAALILFLIFPESAQAQSLAPFLDSSAIAWAEYGGMLAIGWGVGVTGWLVTGHQAVSCLFVEMPRAWKLWQRKILTNSFPIYKYLIGGGLLLLLGTLLVNQLWGVWTQAFDVGIVAGTAVGAAHSFLNAQESGNPIDFLEANQRFLNEKEVTLFTEYERP